MIVLVVIELLNDMIFGTYYLLLEHRRDQRAIGLRVKSSEAYVHFPMVCVTNTIHVYEALISTIMTSYHLLGKQIQVALVKCIKLVVCASLRPV